MPAQHESGRVKPRLPAVAGADCDGVVEEAVFFFLLGQLGEFGVEGVVTRPTEGQENPGKTAEIGPARTFVRYSRQWIGYPRGFNERFHV